VNVQVKTEIRPPGQGEPAGGPRPADRHPARGALPGLGRARIRSQGRPVENRPHRALAAQTPARRTGSPKETRSSMANRSRAGSSPTSPRAAK
jgi:hypothetical protein